MQTKQEHIFLKIAYKGAKFEAVLVGSNNL